MPSKIDALPSYEGDGQPVGLGSGFPDLYICVGEGACGLLSIWC